MRPYDLQDPRIHTVLSGEVYTCMCFLIDMVNVSLELKDPKGKEGTGSLARFDFKKCKLLYESFSNQTKSINLVSHSMMAFDTRYSGQKPSHGMTNVFNCIFQPSKSSSATQGSIQIELHFRSTKDSSCFTVVLNNLRVFLIFDWLLLVHDFLHTPFEFEARGKLRHRHTHDLRIHQLQVRVNGWEQVSPVSVDKVGTFFRYAAPDKNSSSSTIGSPSSRTNNIQDEFFIAVENIDSYCVLISSKAVYFLKSGDYVDREAIFLEVKYDDLYHCLVSKDHGKVYVQVTKKAANSSSGVSIPGPSHQKPMVHVKSEVLAVKLSQEINYAKSLYYEQQLMLRLSENQEQLELDS